MRRSLAAQALLVATGNKGKLAEYSALLEPFGTKLVSLSDLGLYEPEETQSSFVGNARIKARAGAMGSGLPALADDSGLIVDAMAGAPGIYTADWAERGNGRDFGGAMQKIWSVLNALNSPGPHRAWFHCTIVVAWPDGEEVAVDGEVEGHLVWPPRGMVGHGFDPMFGALGQSMTFAEMSEVDKNRISHRAQAFEKLRGLCFT